MAGSTQGLIGSLRGTGGSPVRRATLGTVGTTLIGQLVLVASGVIVARMLGPENRGYLALLILVPLIVAKVGGLGLPLAITFHVARERASAGAIWAALRPVVLLQSGLLAGIHAMILWALLRDDPDYVVSAGLVTLALVPATLAQDYGLAILQGRGRFLAFNLLRTALVVVYAAAAAILLVTDTDGLGDVAAVWTATNVVLGLGTLVTALRRLEPAGVGGPAPPLRELVAFGAKGLLGASSPIEHYRLDQAVVGLVLSPTALGLYAVAVALSNLPRFIATSVGMVAYPHLAAAEEPREARRKLWRFFVVTVGACLAIVVPLELASGWLVTFFFGEAFEDSTSLVRILLLASLLVAARRVLADGARGLGMPALGTVAEVVSLVTLVPALVVFIDLWGAEGVAWALVAGGATSLLVMLAGVRFERSVGSRVRRGALRSPSGRLGGALGVLVLLLAADALAVAVTVASPGVAAYLAAVLLVVLVVAVVRRRLPRFDPAAERDADPLPPGRAGLDAARAVYYLGLLSIGFIVLRPIAGTTASDLLFLGALGLTLLALIALGRPAPLFLGPVILIGVTLFAMGGLLSSFGADSPVESVSVVARVVYLTVLWFWLGAVLLDRPAFLRTAMIAWVASAALGGAGAIAQTLWGDVIPGALVNYGRVSGFAYHYNDLGGLCAVAAAPAAMLIATARTATGRLTAVLGLLLLVAGLMLSNSITGIGAAVVAAVVWVALTRPDVRVIVPAVAAVLVIAAFASTNNRYWESPIERFTTSSERSGTSESTLFTRVDSYEAAWADIQDSPLIGVGLAPEAPNTETGLGVHNMFLAAWFQAGILAAIGLVMIAAAAFAMGWRAVAAARDAGERNVASALFAALVAFFLFGQAQEVLFQRYGWVSVALVVALRAQQRARVAAPAAAFARETGRMPVPAPTG
jgi:O-antigen/teichoic acid export membrane protein/O-antigen ligase